MCASLHWLGYDKRCQCHDFDRVKFDYRRNCAFARCVWAVEFKLGFPISFPQTRSHTFSMPRIFSYGTLQQSDAQLATFSRPSQESPIHSSASCNRRSPQTILTLCESAANLIIPSSATLADHKIGCKAQCSKLQIKSCCWPTNTRFLHIREFLRLCLLVVQSGFTWMPGTHRLHKVVRSLTSHTSVRSLAARAADFGVSIGWRLKGDSTWQQSACVIL